MLASESLLTLESIATSFQKFFNKLREENGNQMQSGMQGVLAILCNRLGTSAEKLLKHRWDKERLENSWKSKVSFFFLPFFFSYKSLALHTSFSLGSTSVLTTKLYRQFYYTIVHDFIVLILYLYYVLGGNGAKDTSHLPGK